MAKTRRTSAAKEAKAGFQTLLEVFESLQQAPPHNYTLMARKIAGGVSKLQDAMWKNGLDCRCAQPQKKRTLEWVCSCETRQKGSRRRKS